jgi:hypothetical protein
MKNGAIHLLFALVFAGGLFSSFAAPPDPGWRKSGAMNSTAPQRTPINMA